MNELLVLALRATSGRHADAARDVLLTVLFLQILAASDHEGPPHASSRAPRRPGNGWRTGRRSRAAGRVADGNG